MKYKVIWGKSVYYKVQFEKENCHSKIFYTKEKALKFLKKINKLPDTDFSDLIKV